jgi:hypothetical protein
MEKEVREYIRKREKESKCVRERKLKILRNLREMERE